MPIFEKPTYARYVPSYVGSPTEEIKALSQKKEEDYYKNLDNFNLTKAALANLDIHPIHEEVRTKLQDFVESSMKGTVEKGDYENSGIITRKLASVIATDSYLQTALRFQQDYKTWKKEERRFL